MRTHKLALLCMVLWLVLAGLFAGLGFLHGGTPYPGEGFYWESAQHDAVGFGGLGVAVATFVSGGIFATRSVRAHGLERGWAALLVLLSSVLGAVLPPLLMFLVLRSGQWDAGDGQLMALLTALLTVPGGFIAYVVLTLCVLYVPRKLMPNPASPVDGGIASQ